MPAGGNGKGNGAGSGGVGQGNGKGNEAHAPIVALAGGIQTSMGRDIGGSQADGLDIGADQAPEIPLTAGTALTEANDSVASTTHLVLLATFSKTEASDTVASTSHTSLHAVVVVTEAEDITSATAHVVIHASFGATEAADVLAAAALSAATSTSTMFEEDDTVFSLGGLSLLGIAALVESVDDDDVLFAELCAGAIWIPINSPARLWEPSPRC